MRTKSNIRSMKSKGSQFEMDVQWSLQKLFPDITRLGGEGQWREIDLESKASNAVFECKRHAGFSWNELVKYYEKLELRSPDAVERYVVFKANRQPTLVMTRTSVGLTIRLFEDMFNVRFEKHIPTKKQKL